MNYLETLESVTFDLWGQLSICWLTKDLWITWVYRCKRQGTL